MSFTHIDPQPAKDKKVVEERVFCDWRDTPSILQCLNVCLLKDAKYDIKNVGHVVGHVGLVKG